MDTRHAIHTLRAVRHFSGAPLPDETIHRILEAARWTGSAKNTQPWQFVVVRERQTLQALSTCGAYAGHLAGAALAVVVVTPPGYPLFDAGRLAQNMMLAAWADGVGSCIASLHEEGRVRALLGVPEGLQGHTAISFGYPLPDAPKVIEGRPREEVLASIGRRSLEELVHWERW
jgi:nitroreductase